jgi:hypothetical protein
MVQMKGRDCHKLLMNGKRQAYILAEVILGFIYIKFGYWANDRGKYGERLCTSMIDDNDGHMPSPLIMFTCTKMLHALLQWPKNKGVHLKASKSKLKADRPDHSNYSNYKNDRGKNTSCYTATCGKLLTSAGVTDSDSFLMNTWNSLPESYKQKAYINTLTTVNRQIQQAENPMPAEVISIETEHVDNTILLANLSSEVALEEPEIGSADLNIPIDIICTDNELHSWIPEVCKDYDDKGDDIPESDTIPPISRR